ncbi:urease accessory protein UreF [Argonema antarcticum]|uniref:urease accessory protein UreF n=1 Tax=Argonema antarcticum TaxID=2942763 RepID=UPI0020128217|nr:urease accessory protein UreF [Argonema antarcticum]MCL1470940.1 urease accessory protein UreF [Argonema antarcticum A004/B2]
MLNDWALLSLLQLTNSALPVGAYSYSEGLENLIEVGTIKNTQSLKHWLEQELRYGAIRLEASVMVRGYTSVKLGDLDTLSYWNGWASAARETEELREQSWQMGRALVRLLQHLQPQLTSVFTELGETCNYALAFGIAAAHWQICDRASVLGYLHSWATNLVTAGVKLIPLGQTAGQQLLLDLHPTIISATTEILALDDDQLSSCGWGLSLASMAHETQYTRLFRS